MVIIFLHELSHLIIAKLCKCKVNVYSIGLGRKLIGKQIGNTYYQLGIIPFGGKCDLKGELDYTTDKDAFINLKYRYKLAITLAGCLANILTGIVGLIIGNIFYIFPLLIFGILSIVLGLTNLIPILPLDGSYAIYYPIIINTFGKEKGAEILKVIVNLSLKIMIILNIISLPLIVLGFIFKCFIV